MYIYNICKCEKNECKQVGCSGRNRKLIFTNSEIDKFAQYFQNSRRPVHEHEHEHVRTRTHISTLCAETHIRVFTYSKRAQWNLARDGEGRFDSNERTSERTVSVGLARASYKSAMLIGLSSCRRWTHFVPSKYELFFGAKTYFD